MRHFLAILCDNLLSLFIKQGPNLCTGAAFSHGFPRSIERDKQWRTDRHAFRTVVIGIFSVCFGEQLAERSVVHVQLRWRGGRGRRNPWELTSSLKPCRWAHNLWGNWWRGWRQGSPFGGVAQVVFHNVQIVELSVLLEVHESGYLIPKTPEIVRIGLDANGIWCPLSDTSIREPPNLICPSLFGRIGPIFVDRILPDRIWPIFCLEEGGGPNGGRPEISLFFLSPAESFILSSLSVGSLREIPVVFEVPGPWNVHVWSYRAVVWKPGGPENSKRAHFRVPAFKTPPKFNEKTPRETQKQRNGGGKGKKKSEILGCPAEGGPMEGVSGGRWSKKVQPATTTTKPQQRLNNTTKVKKKKDNCGGEKGKKKALGLHPRFLHPLGPHPWSTNSTTCNWPKSKLAERNWPKSITLVSSPKNKLCSVRAAKDDGRGCKFLWERRKLEHGFTTRTSIQSCVLNHGKRGVWRWRLFSHFFFFWRMRKPQCWQVGLGDECRNWRMDDPELEGTMRVQTMWRRKDRKRHYARDKRRHNFQSFSCTFNHLRDHHTAEEHAILPIPTLRLLANIPILSSDLHLPILTDTFLACELHQKEKVNYSWYFATFVALSEKLWLSIVGDEKPHESPLDLAKQLRCRNWKPPKHRFRDRDVEWASSQTQITLSMMDVNLRLK